MSDSPRPDATPPSAQQIIDREHLKLLAICYYVMGGMYVFFACFGLLYVLFGIAMLAAPEFFRDGRQPPAFIGYLLAGIGGLFVLLGWTFGGLTIFAGRSIQKRRRRTLTFIMAALNCLSIPFGLLLGIFTFVVLSRNSVSRLYDAQSQ